MASNAIRRGGWAALGVVAAAWGCQLFSPDGVYFSCEPGGGCPGDLVCNADKYCVERDAGFDAGRPYSLADHGPWCIPDGGPCIEYPLSGGRDITAIAGLSQDEVWVAGADGFAALWDGQTWTRVDVTGAGSIAGIAAYPATPREWVLASGAGIFRLKVDAGWEGPLPGSSLGAGALTAVAANASSFVVVGANGVCLASNTSRTLSGGRGYWNPSYGRCDGGLPSSSFNSAWGLPDGGFWLAADDGIYRVDLNTLSVSNTDAGWLDLSAVTATAEGRAWATAGVGRVLRYSDSQAKWLQVPNDAGETLIAAAAVGDGAWFAGKSTGMLFRYDGGTMGRVATGASQDVFALWTPPDGRAWAAGGGGLILHWDGGAWAPDPQGSTRALHAVAAGPTGQLWAAGEAATVFARNGDRWEPFALPGAVTGTIRAIWVGASDVWLGVDSRILRVSGGQATPEDILPPDGGNITSLWGAGGRPTVATGEGSSGLYQWNDTSWVSMDAGRAMYAVAGANGIAYAVGAGGKVMQNLDGGWASFASPGTSSDLHGVWTRDGTEVWVAAQDGSAWRYTGGWANENSPAGTLTAIAGASVDGGLYFVGDAGTILRFLLPLRWDALPTGTRADFLAATYQEDAGLFVVGADGKILHYNVP